MERTEGDNYLAKLIHNHGKLRGGHAMSMPKNADEPTANDNPLPASADANIKGALAALQRAAQRARLVAQQTGTDLIVVRAGQVVRVTPEGKVKP